ncbi:hypothetical protein Pfo_003584 [Paulownia fortunei]|nr:hypothetical protein Pfo_003584 [Paulownia fortunei]
MAVVPCHLVETRRPQSGPAEVWPPWIDSFCRLLRWGSLDSPLLLSSSSYFFLFFTSLVDDLGKKSFSAEYFEKVCLGLRETLLGLPPCPSESLRCEDLESQSGSQDEFVPGVVSEFEGDPSTHGLESLLSSPGKNLDVAAIKSHKKKSYEAGDNSSKGMRGIPNLFVLEMAQIFLSPSRAWGSSQATRPPPAPTAGKRPRGKINNTLHVNNISMSMFSYGLNLQEGIQSL